MGDHAEIYSEASEALMASLIEREKADFTAMMSGLSEDVSGQYMACRSCVESSQVYNSARSGDSKQCVPGRQI